MSVAPPTPPATRTLSVVLREALATAQEVRMVVAKALPDEAGINTAAYMTVEIEGQRVNIPKINGAGLGGSTGGYAVYVLITKDFMLAVGTVVPSAGIGGGGVLPVGGILQWPTATAPAGFLACDGAAFVAVTYPLLYAVLGTNVTPDLRRRVPMGLGGGVSIGQSDGLALANRHVVHYHRVSGGTSGVGDHQHPSAGGHTHVPANGNQFATSVGASPLFGTGTPNEQRNTVAAPTASTNSAGDHQHGAAGGHSHTFDLNTSGSGPQDGPAFLVLNYVIRAQ